MSAQKLLLQHRESKDQSKNYTEIVVVYQKSSYASNWLGRSKPLE
jgi:hypothetical protein